MLLSVAGREITTVAKVKQNNTNLAVNSIVIGYYSLKNLNKAGKFGYFQPLNSLIHQVGSDLVVLLHHRIL